MSGQNLMCVCSGNVRPIWRVVPDRDLATCGVFRGNRARPPAWPVCASFRPLDIHEYVFGAKSCATRLKPMGSARLSAAKGAAYVTLMSSRRFLRPLASGPVRRVVAPAGCRAIHGAMPRRGIPLLASLASRNGKPTNRVSASHSASRSLPPPLANTSSAARCALVPGERGGLVRPERKLVERRLWRSDRRERCSHIAFRPLLAYRVSDLRSKRTNS